MSENLLEKTKELCEKKNISVPNLEKLLGFGNHVIYRWRDSSPSIDKVAKVANYFGVSIDYLYGVEPQEKSPVTRGQSEILEAFDSMNEDGKRAAVAMVKGLATTPIYKRGDKFPEVSEMSKTKPCYSKTANLL